ncbi:MAG: hypothetical protein WA432_03015 [Candidatus Babeliaceae bacterium]
MKKYGYIVIKFLFVVSLGVGTLQGMLNKTTTFDYPNLKKRFDYELSVHDILPLTRKAIRLIIHAQFSMLNDTYAPSGERQQAYEYMVSFFHLLRGLYYIEENDVIKSQKSSDIWKMLKMSLALNREFLEGLGCDVACDDSDLSVQQQITKELSNHYRALNSLFNKYPGFYNPLTQRNMYRIKGFENTVFSEEALCPMTTLKIPMYIKQPRSCPQQICQIIDPVHENQIIRRAKTLEDILPVITTQGKQAIYLAERLDFVPLSLCYDSICQEYMRHTFLFRSNRENDPVQNDVLRNFIAQLVMANTTTGITQGKVLVESALALRVLLQDLGNPSYSRLYMTLYKDLIKVQKEETNFSDTTFKNLKKLVGKNNEQLVETLKLVQGCPIPANKRPDIYNVYVSLSQPTNKGLEEMRVILGIPDNVTLPKIKRQSRNKFNK